MTLRFVSAFSEKEWLDDAIQEACEQILSEISGEISFCVFFASGFPSVLCFENFGRISSLLNAKHVIGCNAEGVVHDGCEYEGSKNLTILAASADTVSVDTFHLKYAKTVDGTAFTGWPDRLTGPWPDGSALLVLADPMTFPTDILLHRLNQDHPGLPVFGGMCSGAFGNESFVGDPRQKSLSVISVGADCFRDGAVLMRLSGVQIRGIVSQGCRPIGEPMVITDCERNEILELGGKSPVQQLESLFRQLPARDQQAFQSGLHLGRAITEYRESFGYGDFLIRNLTNIDQDSGVIAANEYFRKGQTIQFHIRDQASADADLSQLSRRMEKQLEQAGEKPLAAISFLCNGRGLNLFDSPNHDMSLLQEKLGPVPAAGFFAAGEIGPVEGENHVHGFTFSSAIFSQKSS